MERLTMHSSKDKDNILYSPKDEIAIVEKLAAYEDTGFTPENIYNMHESVIRQSNCIIRTGKRIEELETERDYWEREAKKYYSQLGEIRMLMEQEN